MLLFPTEVIVSKSEQQEATVELCRRMNHWKRQGTVTLGNFFLATCLAISLRRCDTRCTNRCQMNINEHEMNMPRNVFVAVTVARSRTNFYFSQRLRQQKNCETCSSIQGMLHKGTVRASCLRIQPPLEIAPLGGRER